MERIRKDFDRIAVLSECDNSVGGVYDSLLLSFIPAPCSLALEVGCGTGAFTRLLANLADRVTAIDLSGEMVRIARHRSAGYPNIAYRVGNIVEIDLAVSQLDCIIMIAALHHLPAAPVLEKLKRSLRPGGVLILHDLFRPEGLFDRLIDLVRLPTNLAYRWFRVGKLRASREVRQAWAEHGRSERYLTKREVRAMRDDCLSGAYVKYHLLWRYTVVWRKREAA
jgi:SAM-dependent methyltransferase